MKKIRFVFLLIPLIIIAYFYLKSSPPPTPSIAFVGQKHTQPIQTLHYQVSHPPGIYTQAINLAFTADTSTEIYYTLNGKKPKPGQTYTYRYSGPIKLTESGVSDNQFYTIPTTKPEHAIHHHWKMPDSCRQGYAIKVRPFQGDSAISQTAVYSYFIQTKTHHSLPIVALTADHEKLWSDNKGIFVPGIDADTSHREFKGNYYQDWKVPCHMEYFSVQGQRLFTNRVDLKVYGLRSPLAPQKSLKLYAKKKYGMPYFTHSFFPNDTLTQQKRIVLRTPFSAWHNRLNADAIISKIAENFNVDVSNSTPVVVYINGEYWGIQNLRERIDKHYIAQHYQLNPEQIDIVMENQKARAGSSKDYIALCEYISTHDLSIDSVYRNVSVQFDMPSLMDYFILQTFFNNVDWPINNHVLWKHQNQGTKWRYLLYDLDAAFADEATNSILRAIIDDETHQINNGTLVFANLIKHPEFKKDFITRYRAAMLNKLTPEIVTSVIDQFEHQYAYDLMAHIGRWHHPENLDLWYAKNEAMRDFALNRKDHVLEHLNALEAGAYDVYIFQ